MTVAELLQTLRETLLVEPDQLLSSAQEEQGVATLLARLTREGVVTEFQAQELAEGRGLELVLGPYVLLERLGAGGMGEVFRARQRLLDRVEAVKLIKEDFLRHPSARQRFQREMKAVAPLTHPNIVRAYSAGAEGGRHYLAMEFLEGVDLARLVSRDGPLKVSRACDYISQAARGLENAREHGLVHRDVKPSNLMVTREGVVKVLDFGLARLVERSGELTGAGAVLGTPDYMAPEQLEGSASVDIRADVYSLGCTLYYLLAGRVPFPASTLREAYTSRLKGSVRPIEEVRPDVPAELSALLGRMMAQDAADRPATPGVVVDSLAPFLEGAREHGFLATLPEGPSPSSLTPSTIGAETLAGVVATPTVGPSPAGSSRWPWYVGSVAAVAVLSLVIVLARNGGGGGGGGGSDEEDDNEQAVVREKGLGGLQRKWIPPEERFEGLPEEVVSVVGESRGRHWGPANTVVFSATGDRVYSGGEDGAIRVWDTVSREELAVLRGHEGGVRQLALLPEGRLLVSGGEDGVRVWDTSSGKSIHTLGSRQSPASVGALRPDGREFATAGERARVRIWDVKDGSEGPWVSSGEMCETIDTLAYSPDGKLLVTGGVQGGARRGSLLIFGRQPLSPLELDPDTGRTLSRFSHDGKHLLVTCGKNRVDRLEVATGKRETVYAPDPKVDYTSALAWCEDKNLLAVAYGLEIHLVDSSKKKRLSVLSDHVGEVRALAFSLAGRRLASASLDGSVRLWDTRDFAAIASPKGHGGSLLSVALSPDGRRLATAGLDGVRLWSLGGRGFKDSAGLPGPPGAVDRVSFLLGGTRLLMRNRVGERRYQVWSVSDDLPRPGLSMPSSAPDWWPMAVSPDGNSIAERQGRFVTFRSVSTGALTGTSISTSADPVTAVAYSPDGKLLASGTGVSVQLWELPMGKLAGESTQGCAGPMAFSPDGHWLVYGPTWEELVVCTVRPFQGGVTLRGHTRPIRFISFTADGKRIATAGEDGRIGLWDRTDGKELWSRRLPGAIHGACLSSDGTHLVTANSNGTAFVFRLPSLP